MLLVLSTPAIWVTNPYTGKPFNVAPIFDAFNQFDVDEKPDNSLKEAVSRTLKHINLIGCAEQQKLVNLNYDLYRLEELFECLVKAPSAPSPTE